MATVCRKSNVHVNLLEPLAQLAQDEEPLKDDLRGWLPAPAAHDVKESATYGHGFGTIVSHVVAVSDEGKEEVSVRAFVDSLVI
ncbi:hypothetical protein PT974_09472 [Cladobotryum mycophilum]|uniref:Uncharacterized protein n=1 Tax=Cladobotryum mycophilum TaxID=491253 RepID=A0ABR0SG83_9HYPO